MTDGAPATPAPRIVTVTPGRTALDSSVTVPTISPVVRCARAGAAAAVSAATARIDVRTPRRMLSPLDESPSLRRFDRNYPRDTKTDDQRCIKTEILRTLRCARTAVKRSFVAKGGDAAHQNGVAAYAIQATDQTGTEEGRRRDGGG